MVQAPGVRANLNRIELLKNNNYINVLLRYVLVLQILDYLMYVNLYRTVIGEYQCWEGYIVYYILLYTYTSVEELN